MDNKGFTLIELLISIILLSIVTSITTVAVVNILQGSKEKSYDLVVNSVKIGAKEYFEECENSNIIGTILPCDIFKNECINSSSECENCSKKCATMNFESLIKYGFLESSAVSKEGEKEFEIVENPKTNDNMNDCEFEIMKVIDSTNYSTWYEFKPISTETFCPTKEEYAK